MSYTADDLLTLERAVASGVMRVRYSDGKEVTYRSMADLLGAISVVKAQLAAATGAPRQMAVFTTFSRG